jgi:Ca2+-binding RTX toxin-like protein
LASISISGGASPSVAVYGKNLSLTAALGSSSGHDTINLGLGNDTIVQTGQATVGSGSFGSSSITGGTLGEVQTTLQNAGTDVSGVTHGVGLYGGAVSTVIGGALDEIQTFAQNTLKDTRTDLSGVFSGVKQDVATITGGTGGDTLTGGAGKNVFEFLSSEAGGHHTITNFVSQDQLYVNGYSLSYLAAQHDISVQGGNTFINIDGGKTSIELKGFTGLNSSEIVTHKS